MKRTVVFINNNKSKGRSFFVESLNPFILCRIKTFDQLEEEEFAEHVKHYSKELLHKPSCCWTEKAAQE